MKKFAMTIAAALIVVTASAQYEKGRWLLNGNTSLGFNSYTFSSGPDATIFNIGAKAGIFAANSFVLGINGEYLSINQSSAVGISTIGFFMRSYMGNVFLGAGFNSVTTSVSGTYSGSSSASNIPFEIGIAAFIAKNVAIEPIFTYAISTDSQKGGVASAIPGLGGAKTGIGIRLGITVYLGNGDE